MSDTAKKIDHSGRFKTGHQPANKGKTLSDETKTKISEALFGNTNAKNPLTLKQYKLLILKNNKITTYDSINEAARALNINHTRIVKYFTNNQQKPYKGQYTFKKLKLISFHVII